MKHKVTQDPNSRLNYWLNFGELLGGSLITNVSIDPNGVLPNEVTVTSGGFNDSSVTDDDGVEYPAATLAGFTFSGGKVNSFYRVRINLTTDSSEIISRSVNIRIVEK